MSSASLIKTPPQKVSVNGAVFYTATGLILLLTAILIAFPEDAGHMLGVRSTAGGVWVAYRPWAFSTSPWASAQRMSITERWPVYFVLIERSINKE